ncbi:MAG: translation initiation factor IF-2 N-terminal domain-containing protein, partial [Muribaculaceae bacterium]|nr:translation initiation factor IF-2 N-terminal domain-containing protein [Muribaculaceae bacterium]
MARTRISKIAKDLNIAVSTAVEFLRKKNIEIDSNPNTRIEDNIVDLLIDEFDTDGAQKAKKTAFLSNNNKEKETPAEKPAKPAAEAESAVAGPKVIGKVEIDRYGNVVKKVAEQPKAEPVKVEQPAPKPVAKPAPAPAPAQKPAAPAVDDTPVGKETPKPEVKPVVE